MSDGAAPRIRMAVTPPLARKSISTSLLFVLPAALFLWFASPGLNFYFNADDIMNLRQAWPTPYPSLLLSNLIFWRQAYRPLGLLWYRIIYDSAGLNPLPFHLICFALLLLNAYLLYRLAVRLTGSIEAGLLTALIGCFHSRMEVLYSTPSTIYDILCYTFFSAALLKYIAIRQAGLSLSPRQIVLLCAFYICALNSKEMAVTLPIFISLYDLIWHRRVSYLLLVILILITFAFLAPKLLISSPLTTSYHPQYTLARLLENWRAYLALLFYRSNPLPLWCLLTVWISFGAIAIVLRSKPLLFCYAIVMIAPLPVCFIEARGLNVFYIPFIGWSLYAAVMFLLIIKIIGNLPLRIALATALLFAVHTADRGYRFFPADGQNFDVRQFEVQFTFLHPSLSHGARILFLNDPFHPDEWTPSSLLQLHFHDPDLDILRAKMPDQKPLLPSWKYDVALDYREGKLIDASPHAVSRAILTP